MTSPNSKTSVMSPSSYRLGEQQSEAYSVPGSSKPTPAVGNLKPRLAWNRAGAAPYRWTVLPRTQLPELTPARVAQLATEMSHLMAVNDGMLHHDFVNTVSPHLRGLSGIAWNAVFDEMIESTREIGEPHGDPQASSASSAASAVSTVPNGLVDGRLAAATTQHILTDIEPDRLGVLRRLHDHHFDGEPHPNDFTRYLSMEMMDAIKVQLNPCFAEPASFPQTDHPARNAAAARGRAAAEARAQTIAIADMAMVDVTLCHRFSVHASPHDHARSIVTVLEGPEFDARLQSCLGLIQELPLIDVESAVTPVPASDAGSNASQADDDARNASPTGAGRAPSIPDADADVDVDGAWDAPPSLAEGNPPELLRANVLAAMLDRLNYSTQRRKSMARIEPAIGSLPPWARIALGLKVIAARPHLPYGDGADRRGRPHLRRDQAFKQNAVVVLESLVSKLLDDVSASQATLERLIEQAADPGPSNNAEREDHPRELAELSLQLPSNSPLQSWLRAWSQWEGPIEQRAKVPGDRDVAAEMDRRIRLVAVLTLEPSDSPLEPWLVDWAHTGRLPTEAATRMSELMAADATRTRTQAGVLLHCAATGTLNRIDASLQRATLDRLQLLFDRTTTDPLARTIFRAEGLGKLPLGQVSIGDVDELVARFNRDGEQPLELPNAKSGHPLSWLMPVVSDLHADRVGTLALEQIERMPTMISKVFALNSHLEALKPLSEIVRMSQLEQVMTMAKTLPPIERKFWDAHTDAVGNLHQSLSRVVVRLEKDRRETQGAHQALSTYDSDDPFSLNSDDEDDPNVSGSLEKMNAEVIALRLQLLA